MGRKTLKQLISSTRTPVVDKERMRWSGTGMD